MTTRTKFVLAAALALVGSGCQDLVVENTNQPDRRRALGQPDAIELLVSSAYPRFYNRIYRGTAGYIPLPMTGDEATNSDNTSGGRDLSVIPRLPYDNNPVNTDQYGLASNFWNDFYEVFANATDALKVINGGLVITSGEPPVDNTQRVRVFGKLAQGLALGYIGLLYDRAFIYDENTPDEIIANPVGQLELSGYQDLIAKSVALLNEAAQLATAGADFAIPRLWLYAPADLTRNDLVQIANAYAVRFRVLGARTPADRAAINWQSVLTNASAVTRDVLAELNLNATGQSNNYLQFAQHNTSSRKFYASNLLIGAADVSGAYQAWLAKPVAERTRFTITTPDRRVTGATPTTNGKYFRYVAQDLTNPLYGTYRQSYYQWFKMNGAYQGGNFAVLPLSEIDLYRAEAYIRLNQQQAAVDIINRTRTIGELPAVTVSGVAASPTCVPRTNAGACGNLMDALIYERMIEGSYIDPLKIWADRRGFGTLTRGTLLHLPIPRAQQQVLGLEYYTFGGAGAGSAQ
ncbi:MAG: RagB/SusD family nutrient uptake outer membrane protein [Longimicrobiales bacterium]